MNNKVFLNIFGIVFVLLFVISCSDSAQQVVQKEKGKTQVETLMPETTENTVSKTICTDCHNVNDEGDLKFRDKDGKFELRKETKIKITPEVN